MSYIITSVDIKRSVGNLKSCIADEIHFNTSNEIRYKSGLIHTTITENMCIFDIRINLVI